MATTLEAATDNPPDAARTRLGPGPTPADLDPWDPDDSAAEGAS
jgi:hypothetical protein